MCKSFPLIGQLPKEMGIYSCIRTKPIPFTKESLSTIKVLVNSGVVKTKAMQIASLSCSIAWASSRVQENASLLFNATIGATILL